jgi:hypothetical protein
MKQSFTKRMLWLMMITGLLVLTACSPATPTLDAQLVYTAAAQTVMAQLTREAEGKATPTAQPPSPTSGIIPTAMVIEVTLTPFGGVGITPTTTALPILPTATISLSKAADQALWISNTPADDALVNTNAKFDVTWQMKNIGETTWKTSYKIRYYAGDLLVEKKVFNFAKEVKPGEIGEFTIDAVGNSKAGAYSTWWKLTNDLGQNFGDMSLRVIVVKPDQSPTPVPSITPTVTVTPTSTE